MEETYMHRCLQLAQLGQGYVAPNPMVGAVLVHDNRIIGEGYHQQYGGPHAEVNCISSVKPEDEQLISQSTIYVSLEPCAHFGKTPPCANLIIDKRIPRVVIGCRDPFVQVNGKGIEKLQSAGVDIAVGILERECKELNKRFFTFHTQHRPYIVLKWAQTADGKIAAAPSPNSVPNVRFAPLPPVGREHISRLLISNEYTNRIVHKWRSEEMAILVGTNTALYDNPELTTRLWPGSNPVRLVVDMDLKLPPTLKLFNSAAPTIVFNTKRHHMPEGILASADNYSVGFYQVTEDVSLVYQITNALYQMNIQSVLVEGGAFLLQSFMDEDMWDEAKIITNQELIAGDGLPAPILKSSLLKNRETIYSDTIRYYYNQLA